MGTSVVETVQAPPASGAAERALDSLEAVHAPGPRWRDARYLWLKTVPPIQRGKVGEDLFKQLCRDADVTVGPGRGGGQADCSADGLAVEVKLSTLYDRRDGGTSHYQWLQLRPSSDFDVAALIAVDPDQVRVWVVDKATALSHAQGQHTGKQAQETQKLTVHEDAIPDWLGPDVSGDPAALKARLEQFT